MTRLQRLESQWQTLNRSLMSVSHPSIRTKKEKRMAVLSRQIAEERAKRGNPRGRKMTKAQKRANASKGSKRRRVAAALKKFLKAQNPAAKFAGAKIRRNKGSITIIPIKLRRASR
jgi:hypothetical protein